MRRIAFPSVLFVVFALVLSPVASAVLCSLDAVPAATLLLPYFEVDLDDWDGLTTLFSVNNASAEATVAHVVLWTNWSAPTIDFDLYLTGYDVQTINLHDVFNGRLPVTASVGQDPAGAAVGVGISPNSNLGIPAITDVHFPSCTGLLPYTNPVVQGTALDRLIHGHVGQPVTTLGGRCLGADLGDNVARGYVTVDNASACSLVLDPGFPGYFANGAGIASDANVLWGDFFIVDPRENLASGNPLVHLEAHPALGALTRPLLSPVDGVDLGPIPNATGYTFYGRYTLPFGGSDNREPLGTSWAVRYLTGGVFSSGTSLLVWRDSTAADVLPAGATCGVGPSWVPLNELAVLAFDEEEQVEELCTFAGGVISPPDDDDPACFPLETGRYRVGAGALSPASPFGWLFLDLDLPPDAVVGDVDFGSSGLIAQSWVGSVLDAAGRLSVGFPAVAVTTACQDLVLPIPP